MLELASMFVPYDSTRESVDVHLLDVYRCLLKNGADPHLLGWGADYFFDNVELTIHYLDTGCLCTPADAIHLRYKRDNFDAYVKTLREQYNEIIVDADRDVFWDAKEEIDGEGYGCSYESKRRW